MLRCLSAVSGLSFSACITGMLLCCWNAHILSWVVLGMFIWFCFLALIHINYVFRGKIHFKMIILYYLFTLMLDVSGVRPGAAALVKVTSLNSFYLSPL